MNTTETRETSLQIVEQNKPAPPIQITEDIQFSLNRLGRAIDDHAESGIRVGKELIQLKSVTPYGEFGQLVEWAYGIKATQRATYMRIARNHEDKICGQPQFSNEVLIELDRKGVPESAREEAATKDSLTVKQSKELTAEHKAMEKELKKLQAKYTDLQKDSTPKEVEPNFNLLIPRVKEMVDNGDIMPAMWRKISVMPIDGQEAWLSLQIQKQSIENQLNEKTARVKELEDMPEPEAKIVEKEVIPLDVQEKLEKAEGSLAKLRAAERSAKNIRSDFNKISSDKHALEKEISILKDQLKINDPENVDIALASDLQEIQELLKSKIIRIKEQQAKHDHTMPIALAVIEDTISMLSAFSDSVNEIDAIEV